MLACGGARGEDLSPEPQPCLPWNASHCHSRGVVASAQVVSSCSTKAPGLVHAPTPEPGSLVFWYNFNQDGAYDRRHLHAGCDVTIGEKWALNLWFTPARSTLLPVAIKTS